MLLSHTHMQSYLYPCTHSYGGREKLKRARTMGGVVAVLGLPETRGVLELDSKRNPLDMVISFGRNQPHTFSSMRC